MPNHVDHLIFAVLVVISCTLVSGFEPSPLQDFCVAVNETQKAVFVNGKACKDPKQAQADDFFISGLDLPSNTSTSVGSGSTTLNVDRIPGLNTLGLSISRLDYAPGGGNPPHMHPRATEIALVLEGTIYSGFVTSNPENRLISKVLNKGDVFVLPMGLIHFQQNIGEGNAVVLVAFSSQHPGAISIANAVFGSNPSIDSEILAKAFQVDKSVVDGIKEKFQLANQL